MQNSGVELTEALKLLNSNGGEEFAVKLERGVHVALAEIHGDTNTEIVSAVELAKEEKARLQQLLIRMLGRELKFNFHVSPVVLGGFKVTVGDWKLDASIAGRLKHMREIFGRIT